MRVLLVEDDRMIAENICDGLARARYAVDWSKSGTHAEVALNTGLYDLVLLDLALPGKQGLDVLRTMRAQGAQVPVLILTAKGSIAARIEGLDAGADDYLVKPFDMEEMLARARALLRRQVERNSSMIRHGAVAVNLATHEVWIDDAPLHLSAMEFSLLRALLDDPGKVVTKVQLEQRMYGWQAEIESNAIDVFVHRLRKKLGNEFIKTVRGVGFKTMAVQ